jgi:hypothetical protein
MLNSREVEVLEWLSIRQEKHWDIVKDHGFGYGYYGPGDVMGVYKELIEKDFIINVDSTIKLPPYSKENFNLLKITLAGLWALFLHKKGISTC